MNIPQITSIDNALRVYYNHAEIGNKEMTVLFGKRSATTISNLKKMVKSEMNKRAICSYGANMINTAISYEVWGIDVDDMERRRAKIKKLDL